MPGSCRRRRSRGACTRPTARRARPPRCWRRRGRQARIRRSRRPMPCARSGDTTRDQLKRLEHLAALAPENPESALSLARGAIDANAFDRARQALDGVAEAARTQRWCLLIGRDRVERDERPGPGARMDGPRAAGAEGRCLDRRRPGFAGLAAGLAGDRQARRLSAGPCRSPNSGGPRWWSTTCWADAAEVVPARAGDRGRTCHGGGEARAGGGAVVEAPPPAPAPAARCRRARNRPRPCFRSSARRTIPARKSRRKSSGSRSSGVEGGTTTSPMGRGWPRQRPGEGIAFSGKPVPLIRRPDGRHLLPMGEGYARDRLALENPCPAPPFSPPRPLFSPSRFPPDRPDARLSRPSRPRAASRHAQGRPHGHGTLSVFGHHRATTFPPASRC